MIPKIEIDFDFEIWKEKVDVLIYAELKLNYLYKSGKISEKEKKKLKKVIRQMWVMLSYSNPHTNPSLEKAFKLNFG